MNNVWKQHIKQWKKESFYWRKARRIIRQSKIKGIFKLK